MTLDSGDVEAIALRVAELLRGAAPHRHLDTAAVSRMLNVSEEWVREHAAELGAVRLGDGPKGALRFDPAHVRAALEARKVVRRSRVHSSPRPRPTAGRPSLLPLPEDAR